MKRLFCSLALAVCCSSPVFAHADDDEEPHGSGENPAEAAVNWTPLVAKTTVAPKLFQGSDDQHNLVYEIVLTNFTKNPVDLKELQISGDDGKVVKTLSGKDLSAVFTQATGTSALRIAAGGSGIVWVNLSFANSGEAPQRLIHKITASGVDFQKKPITWSYKGPSTKVDRTPPVVISPPLRGGKWVAFGGYCGVLGHRRALFPIDNGLHCAQRYAIDWCRLDADNYSTRGDSKKNESSACYDQPVYAVADGTVYGVVDKFGEQVPYTVKGDDRFTYPAGNSITLNLGNGLYGMYAHLKPKSIKVKPGDKVKRGDVIAHLGNAGNSSGPHLHFHVTDNPHILGSNGVPYVFDEFEVLGKVPNLDQYFKNDQKGLPQSIEDSQSNGKHQLELVREGHIVQFAAP